MEDVWRHGMYAEYARVPLENCYASDERILLASTAEGAFGYRMAALVHLSKQLVALRGLRGIDLQAEETVIVAPATGGFSGAAVEVACATGAKVIAVGRNINTLRKIAENIPRIKIMQMKGSGQEDTKALRELGTIGAYLDIFPAAAAQSTHVRSCLVALKPHGRASLMGAIQGDLPVSYAMAMFKCLTIRGQFMYDREDARGINKLAETGVLKLGKSAGLAVIGESALEDWRQSI